MLSPRETDAWEGKAPPAPREWLSLFLRMGRTEPPPPGDTAPFETTVKLKTNAVQLISYSYTNGPKLCSNMPMTKFQPSTITNKINFRGKLTMFGGSINMPIETVTDETTRSKTRNGKNT